MRLLGIYGALLAALLGVPSAPGRAAEPAPPSLTGPCPRSADLCALADKTTPVGVPLLLVYDLLDGTYRVWAEGREADFAERERANSLTPAQSLILNWLRNAGCDKEPNVEALQAVALQARRRGDGLVAGAVALQLLAYTPSAPVAGRNKAAAAMREVENGLATARRTGALSAEAADALRMAALLQAGTALLQRNSTEDPDAGAPLRAALDDFDHAAALAEARIARNSADAEGLKALVDARSRALETFADPKPQARLEAYAAAAARSFAAAPDASAMERLSDALYRDGAAPGAKEDPRALAARAQALRRLADDDRIDGDYGLRTRARALGRSYALAMQGASDDDAFATLNAAIAEGAARARGDSLWGDAPTIPIDAMLDRGAALYADPAAGEAAAAKLFARVAPLGVERDYPEKLAQRLVVANRNAAARKIYEARFAALAEIPTPAALDLASSDALALDDLRAAGESSADVTPRYLAMIAPARLAWLPGVDANFELKLGVALDALRDKAERRGDFAAAWPLAERLVEFEAKLGDDGFASHMADALAAVARAGLRLGQPQLEPARRAVALETGDVEANPRSPGYVEALAKGQRLLGDTLRATGDAAAARTATLAAASLVENGLKTFADDRDLHELAVTFAVSDAKLAPDAAGAAYQRAVDVESRELKRFGDEGFDDDRLALHWGLLSDARAAAGDRAGALQALGAALQAENRALAKGAADAAAHKAVILGRIAEFSRKPAKTAAR